MPDKNYREEVFVMILVGIIVFLVITGLLVLIILYYQKKRFQHQQQLVDKEKEYAQQLLESKLEIQEQTFNTISSEIHDNVGQILSLAKVQLNIIAQGNSLDISLLNEAKDSVGKAMADLRDIAKSLSSNRIQYSSLFEVAQHELQRIQRAGIMNTIAVQKGDEIKIVDQKKLIIFRIIQESLQNIIKHSKANQIDVEFSYQKDQLTVTVSDNGTGFDSTKLVGKDGQGLQSIMNRAMMIGGLASIESQPGKGTTIIITSPYE
jgi:signal transduction histidine kinase